jgi:hypothetical protein
MGKFENSLVFTLYLYSGDVNYNYYVISNYYYACQNG